MPIDSRALRTALGQRSRMHPVDPGDEPGF